MGSKMEIKLEIPAREMFKARAVTYLYTEVLGKDIRAAERLANKHLQALDDMTEANPTQSAGYWAGVYFDRFVQDCEQL